MMKRTLSCHAICIASIFSLFSKNQLLKDPNQNFCNMKKTYVLLVFSHSISNAASFMMPMMPSSSKSALSMVSREEYLKPHFKSRAIEPKIKKINMEELEDCVESDECDLEEISRMLRDLEHFDSECTYLLYTSPSPRD